MEKLKYSIFVPTYNEAENLPILVWHLVDVMGKMGVEYEIVIIDDKGADGTLGVAHALQKMYDGIVIDSGEGKGGLGEAYRRGMKRATGNMVIIMDADLSHHPRYIPQFIELQLRYDLDVVYGTRYDGFGGVCGWSFGRKMISSGANMLARIFLGPFDTTDVTGSFRLYRFSVLERLIKKSKGRGFFFQTEVAMHAAREGYKGREVAIVFVDRVKGKTKCGKSEILSYAKGLFAQFIEDVGIGF